MDNLTTRLNYRGGRTAEARFQVDKVRTLKKALIYSDQGETIILPDGREFRALINSDKLKNDYDNKILSIPFKDICLNSEFSGKPTSQAKEDININVGDVFTWKETNTKWLVYLRYLEEESDAYFRAEIRKCGSIISINGKDYYAYVRGPVETATRWNQKSKITWNDINYSTVAYIGVNEDTSKLKRFSKVKLNGQNYEVKVVNRMTTGGIMILYLGEDYTNSIEENNFTPEENENNKIKGDSVVYTYDIKNYYIENETGGTWRLSNNKARILNTTDTTVSIEFTTSKKGQVDLIYDMGDMQLILPITINTL